MRRMIPISMLTVLALALTWARSVEPAARAGTAIPRIAAVGDIACKNLRPTTAACQYDDVAAAIGAGDYDKVLLLGDIQYEAGIYQDFVENFDVYFGDLLPSTAPAPGNHEYGDPGAAGYFRYFGSLAPGSSYSFDLGAWHIISLDSTICGAGGLECLPGRPSTPGWLGTSRATTPSARSRSGTTLGGTGSATRRRTGRRTTNSSERSRSGTCSTHTTRTSCSPATTTTTRDGTLADPQGELDLARGMTQFVVGTGAGA